MANKYIVSIEVQKYPYCGRPDDTEDYLSDKICRYTIKIRKKIVRRTKRVFVYGGLILRLTNGIIPSQAIGLPILPTTPPIMRSIHSDTPKKVIIARVINNSPEKIVFTDKQMDQLYDLAVKYRNNSMSREEFILELRGGGIENWVAAFGIIIAIITVLNNVEGFQVPPGAIILPHLQWLYGNQQPVNHFGYGKGAGPRSITVTGATQNAGSDKKQPSSGSWDYKEVMRELDRQSSKKKVEIEVGDQMYILKNPYREDAYELGYKLADKMYDSIRECDTDICDIAENLGFKADNIKNVKDHVFYNKHYLDRLAPAEPVEYRRFDANIQQALAWKRLETGTHTQDDVTWIKHECAERHHELKYGSGYSEAHDHAQSRFDGAPWEDQF